MVMDIVYRRLDALFGKGNFDVRDKKGSILIGVGKIRGRRVNFYSTDFTYKGGSIGINEGILLKDLIRHSVVEGNILIGLIDSGGARIEEGIESLEGFGIIFKEIIGAKHKIPIISVILGPAAGGSAVIAALSDFTIASKERGYIFINGPRIVELVRGIKVSGEDLGGVAIHSKYSGIVDLVGKDDSDAIMLARRLVEFLPEKIGGKPSIVSVSGYPEYNIDIISRLISRGEPYDALQLIVSIVDKDSMLVLKGEYAPEIITSFARIEGMVVGIVACNRIYNDARLGIEALRKISWFLEVCNKCNIPVVMLIDTPGFMVGSDEEKRGLVNEVANLAMIRSSTDILNVCIVVGEVYGGLYILLVSKSLSKGYLYTWPNARLGVMSALEAYKILYSRKKGGLVEEESFFKDYISKILAPSSYHNRQYIDRIIFPINTRKIIINHLKDYYSV
jgi:acetyl-CoA carboxylase carboxyltransferase component